MYVYICQDTPESIFTAIYYIYENRHNLPDTRILLEWEPLLLAEYMEVETDREKSVKVVRTLLRKFGEEDTHFLFWALSSYREEKAEAVYKTIAYGLRHGIKPGHLFDHLADKYVLTAHKLALNARREAQHLKGFLRFQELANGIMYAIATPRNHVLPELMEHFSDRFPAEKFMVLDEVRGCIGVHQALGNWFLVTDQEAFERIKMTEVSEKELDFEELFRKFCQTIAIQERRNELLQRNMLPLHFRTHMTEFQ